MRAFLPKAQRRSRANIVHRRAEHGRPHRACVPKTQGAAMATKKKSTRRYGKKASDKVGEALHEHKQGKLTSGRSGRKVKSRKQAIAIGLSEARKEGGKVPPPPKKKKGGASTKRKTGKRKSS